MDEVICPDGLIAMGYEYDALDIGSFKIISYLVSQETDLPPRVTYAELESFLQGLSQKLTSPSLCWLDQIESLAKEAAHNLRESPYAENPDGLLDRGMVDQALTPFLAVFRNYEIYVIPVGDRKDRDVLGDFAHMVAMIPGHRILALKSASYNSGYNLPVLDPGNGVEAGLRNRDLWPGAVFLLQDGRSSFLPLEDARQRVGRIVEHLVSRDPGMSTREFLDASWLVLSEPAKVMKETPRQRILHLSDLHLGTSRAASTQAFLQAAIKKKYRDVDHIVITGDLFDQPRRRHAQDYVNFIHALQLICDKRPIVVPGNHDQRIFGNSLFGIGRRLRQLADLKWATFVADPVSQTAFFCFDSSRSEDLARGRVDPEQLLKMATEFDVENARGRYDSYLRVALVHHHPYPYVPQIERPIVDPRTWVGREEFVEMRGAENFLSWCAGRGIDIILHGHKHIPRLIVDHVDGGDVLRPMTTVGCGSSLGANGSKMSFNVIEWNPKSQSWLVDFQVSRADGQGFRSAAIQPQSGRG
ncbi:metallophosphoesterase family protein [Streptomyces erythrochromogenes]